MATTAPVNRGGRPAVGATADGATKSRQNRFHSGAGQARALNERAAELEAERKRTGAAGPRITRASLLRDIVSWGLKRPLRELRASDPIPTEPTSSPVKDREATWIPEPGQLDALTAQAAKVGQLKGQAEATQVGVLRLHVDAWLTQNPAPIAG